MMDDLSAYGVHYQTDKATGSVPGKYHWYTPRYEEVLRPMRRSATTVLEIGVLWGASLAMWRDYFQRATVYGVDLEPRTLMPGEPRIHVLQADARDPAVREHLASLGPFDLAVDDASHELTLMRDLAFALLPHTSVYIVEDVSPADQVPLITAIRDEGYGDPEVLISRIPDHVALIYNQQTST